MNKTKQTLIILAIIFSFGSIAWDIYDIVRFFMAEPQYRPSVFYVVFYFIEIFSALTVAILLTLAIWKNGKLFRQRYSMYMSALVISIIMNLFSITSILLIITMFLSDWVWIKPENDKTIIVEKSKEEKISDLRAKLERGEITESEFQDELIKLL